MALDTSSLMMQLSPARKFNFTGGADTAMERERLRLMREQFAETQRQNALDNEYRRTHEAAEQSRAELAAQVEREKSAAAARAKLEEARRKVDEDVSRYRDAGDIEGIDALSPRIQALGGSFGRLGEAEGLPTYQITWDAADAAQAENERSAQASPYGPGETAAQSLDRLGALGYPSLSERGNLDEPALDAPISTEEAFGKSLAASQHYGETGQPLRGPDEPDLMGAVPRDQLDFGALQAQTMRRLKPSLDAYRDSYPEAYQGSTDKSNEAAAAMALPGPKALETAMKMREGTDRALASELTNERKMAEGEKPLTRIEKEKLSTGSYKKAHELAKEYGVGDMVKSQKAGQMVLELLGNNVAWDDPMIGFQLSRMLGSVGAQSNRDIDIALGGDGMGTVDKIKERIIGVMKGGYSDMRREGLMNIVKKSLEVDDDNVYELLDTIDREAAMAKDPEVRRGWLEYKKTIPQEYLDAHDEDKREQGLGDPDELEEADAEETEEPLVAEPPARQGRTTVQRMGGGEEPGSLHDDDEFMDELLIQTEESGLDPNAILGIIGGESGGKADAANDKSSAKGLIQFLDSTARRYGFGSSKEFAQLSRTEQIPYIVEYLRDSGLDEDSPPEDYGIAVAAPAFVGKPDDTVVYREGSKEHAKNEPWWPPGGGDITVGDIKAYYRRHGAKSASSEPEPVEEDEGDGDLDDAVLDALR